MVKTIQKYQGAFNTVIERLKQNDSVLAVMVFGSIITGDLWEESDI
ncbi:MAG: nucleotidyltransferase domain-containing protein, partial [Clostridiaceae bacterium]